MGRARSEPGFRVAWLCFVPEFGRCSFSPSRVPSPLSKVWRREGDGASGGQEDREGRRARYPEPGLHLLVSLCHPPVPTGWEIQGLLLPVLGASGCCCHLGPRPHPSWFHESMNSQVSCSEERDNQPIRVLSPMVVGPGCAPTSPRSGGPS